MEQQFLFTQKKVIAKNTLAMKVKVHGFDCSIETPVDFLNTYGEESGHIEYNVPYLSRVLIVNSTQKNMYATADLLNSTENQELYLVMFEEDILPRNTRIKVFMQGESYRQLEIRDNNKNEGTFVIHQQLVPSVNTTDTTQPEVGLNVPEEPVVTTKKKSKGRNL